MNSIPEYSILQFRNYRYLGYVVPSPNDGSLWVTRIVGKGDLELIAPLSNWKDNGRKYLDKVDLDIIAVFKPKK